MGERADVRLSKRLSLVLRHRPGSVGLELDGEGWVEVPLLLAALTGARPVGHARGPRPGGAEQRQAALRVGPHHRPVLFHGTTRRVVDAILSAGIDRRRRHHVHLSADAATARRVGARRGDPVVLEVDAAGMARAGHRFRRTGNGVWLTDHVPPEFVTVTSP